MASPAETDRTRPAAPLPSSEHDLSLPLVGAKGEPVDLARTLNSHGFAELAPSALDEAASTLAVTIRRPERVRDASASARTAEPPPASTCSEGGRPRVRAAALAGAAHVLRLDHDLSGFYVRVADDPDLAWAARGRAACFGLRPSSKTS